MIRVFTSAFCIVLLLGVLLLVIPADAQRDEATVAANWSLMMGVLKILPRKDWMAISQENLKPLMVSLEKRCSSTAKAMVSNSRIPWILTPVVLIPTERSRRCSTVIMRRLMIGSR